MASRPKKAIITIRRTPGELERERQRQEVEEQMDLEMTNRGYMVFSGFDEISPEAHKRILDLQDEFEAEREATLLAIQRANEHGEMMMKFGAENPDFNWGVKQSFMTGQIQRAAARQELFEARQAEKERKQEEQVQALIKHRSIVKQRNLQTMTGSVAQRQAQIQKERELLEKKKHLEQMKKEQEAERARMLDLQEVLAQSERDAQEVAKRRRQREIRRQQQTFVVYPTGQTLNQEDQEMFDILNELQQ